MDKYDPDQELRCALEAFETSVVTPIIPGELVEWTERVQQTWKQTSELIHFHSKHHHPRQFEQISQTDPDLLPRVELLKVEDEAIECDREALNCAVVRLVEVAPIFEPDEEKAVEQMKSFIDSAIAFVTRVRKQLAAIQTWFGEAFNRDRGIAD